MNRHHLWAAGVLGAKSERSVRWHHRTLDMSGKKPGFSSESDGELLEDWKMGGARD